MTAELILPGRNPAGIGVALLLGAAGSLLVRFVVGLLRGAEATQFGVESIIWAVTGAFAAAAGEKVLLESRATQHNAFV